MCVLDKLNRDFLWSSDLEKRKLHLVEWQKVILPKDKGGLGIHTARVSNESLLAKLVWKILRKENTVWQALIQGKYLKSGNLMTCKAKQSDSPTWKGILHCVELIKPFIRWKVRDGKSIHFWHDNWLESGVISDRGVQVCGEEKDYTLADMWNSDGEWSFEHIQTVIPQDLKDEVLNFQFNREDEADEVIWNETANGLFNYQTAYKALSKLDATNLTGCNKPTSKQKMGLDMEGQV